MIISLLGYMGSGKSHISKILSNKLDFLFIDLDKEISEKLQMNIPEIFEKKGELFFRKEEKKILEEILDLEKNLVLSLGGGTPVYFDNINLINEKSKSVFLRASVNTLTNRILWQKTNRPMLARFDDSEIPEFIAKHLFERNPYYSKAQITIDIDFKSADEISKEIIKILQI